MPQAESAARESGIRVISSSNKGFGVDLVTGNFVTVHGVPLGFTDRITLIVTHDRAVAQPFTLRITDGTTTQDLDFDVAVDEVSAEGTFALNGSVVVQVLKQNAGGIARAYGFVEREVQAV